MAQDPEKYLLSEAEHQRIFERRVKPHIFASAKTSEHPTAILFGGQPGAGKSAAVNMAKEELKAKGGAVEIVGDDLRGYHPKYARLMQADDKTAAFYTDRDSGKWVEKAIDYARQQRVNVIIEGTMRTPHIVAETMKSFREAGYHVEARALAVNEKLSWQGVMQRYEAQKADRGVGRMTTPEAHEAGLKGMLSTLERIEGDKLADQVSIYRRGPEKLYANELKGGEWVNPPQARQVVEAERSRPMSLQERQAYADGYEKLAAAVAKPERQATPEDRKQIEDLRQQARRELVAATFRQEPPAEAVKKFPELAGTYTALAAIQKQAERDGLNQKQTAVVMDAARINAGNQLERGEPPAQKIREAAEVKQDKSYDR